ncbi:hypothetical protein SAMN05444166_8470 [Singulisphaera sp. GP187]|nr:hypothetical protein SAMN05444166_8470 [Singulisphaera sp. GP187]
MNPADLPRAEAFLKSGLDRRPVWVQWHRAYQYFAGQGKHQNELIPYYDSLVAKEPESSALIYLRARIEPDPERQVALLRRANEADPAQPWPYFARGRHLASAARWDESLIAFQKARELHIDAFDIDENIHVARLARGDAKTLVEEYKARLAAVPTEMKTLIFLCDALAVSDQTDQIESVVTEWTNRVGMQYGPEATATARAIGFYKSGKVEACARVCSETGPLTDSPLRAQALLALGQTQEVIDNKAFAKLWVEPWNAVALSLALSLNGQAKEADDWRERAARTMESQGVEDGRAAVLLRAAEPASIAEIERVVVDADETALLCVALGRRFPAKRDEYHAAARRYNIQRKAPYQLILRATDGEKP